MKVMVALGASNSVSVRSRGSKSIGFNAARKSGSRGSAGGRLEDSPSPASPSLFLLASTYVYVKACELAEDKSLQVRSAR